MKKIQIIKKAFRKLKLKGVSSDPSMPQYPDALIDLESFMADLDDNPSINTGYNSTGDNATLEEESGLTLGDLDTISCGLAIRIASDYPGTEVAQQTQSTYRTGLSKMMKRGAIIPTVHNHRRIPRGTGNILNNRYRYQNTFFHNVKSSSDANPFKKDSFIEWPVDFTSWLVGETLTNVVWVSEHSKITIENETFNDTLATAKLTFSNIGVYKVQVTGTSSKGQIVVDINFSVSEKIEG